MKQIFLHIGLFFCLPAMFYGQEFNAKLDTTLMYIGDHNKLSLQWKDTSELQNIEFKQEAWDTLESVELLDETPLTHRENNNIHLYHKEIRFTIFDSGQVILPPIEVSWARADQSFNKRTPSYTIKIMYPNIDTSGLAPIKPIEKEPLKWQDIDGYVYSAIGILLLLALLIYWINIQKKRKEEAMLEERPQDPHEQAFIKLQALGHKDYLEKEEYEAFQVELTFIIREFLGLKYNLNALESTSNELLDKLKETQFPNSKLPVLKELLSMADLVKFAKAEQPGDFHKRMLFEAREIVKQTNTFRG